MTTYLQYLSLLIVNKVCNRAHKNEEDERAMEAVDQHNVMYNDTKRARELEGHKINSYYKMDIVI